MMEERGLENDAYYQLLYERAALYFQVERYRKSYEDCIRIFNHYQTTNDLSNLVKVCTNLTQIARMQEDAQHEIYYAEQAYQYALYTNDNSTIIAALTTLRDAYYYADPNDETDALCADMCRKLDDMLEENDVNAESIIDNLRILDGIGGISEQELLRRIISLLNAIDNEDTKCKLWRVLASYYYNCDDILKATDYYHSIINCFNERYRRIKEKEKENGGKFIIDGTLATIFPYYADVMIMLGAISFIDGDYDQADIYMRNIRSFFENEDDLTTYLIRVNEQLDRYYREALYCHLNIFIHKYNTAYAYGNEWASNTEVCEIIHKYCEEVTDYFSILHRQLPYMTRDERSWYIEDYYQYTTPLIELLSLYSQDFYYEEPKLVSNTLFAIVSYLKGLLLHMEEFYGDMGIDDESGIEDSRSLTFDTQLMFNQKDDPSAVIEFVDYHDERDELKKYVALFVRKDWDVPKMVELCDDNELKKLLQLDSAVVRACAPEPTDTEEIRKEKEAKRKEAEKALLDHLYNGQLMYKLIWSKLEPYLNEGDKVYFSPAGLLHQINIEVLQDENGRLANEKYELHRVSSTRELCIDRPKIEHTSAVLYGGLTYNMDSTALLAQSRAYSRTDDYMAVRGFVRNSTQQRGDWKSLNGAEDEVNAISKRLERHQIQTTKYTHAVGTEESFKALSGKKTPIIHLATHGFFYTNEEAQTKIYFERLYADPQQSRPDNSLKRSGFILAGAQLAWDGKPIPDSVEDGILLAEEIATMDLSGTDLVVLSACQTGLGEITSEGVFGLQRAFKKAGVQTLIMSLWKVDDHATQLMMTTFYDAWLDGKSKHEAFAVAQRTVRNTKGYENPYYWASFIMLD